MFALPGQTIVTRGGRRRVLTSATAAAFTPAEVFAGGVPGAWYDPSDLSTMWQDNAKTVPAAVDAPVGYMSDRSGNGRHIAQANGSKRPILRSAGGRFWLELDGVDDALQTPTIDLTATDKLTVCLGVRYTSPATQVILETSPAADTFFDGTFAFAVMPAAVWAGRGTVTVVMPTADTLNADAVHSCQFDIGGATANDEIKPSLNGALVGSTATGSIGTGNFGVWPLNIGARSGEGAFFAGRIYGIVLTGRALTGAEYAQLNAIMAGKAGL
jgi:hypothetical protein